MQVPKAYKNWAQAMIDTFWFEAIEKRGRPMLSKSEIRQQIEFGISQKQAEDGDPSTWTSCEHCEGEGIYTRADRMGANGLVADQERGLCYQCGGKGAQSEADRRRNWGYQKRQEDY